MAVEPEEFVTLLGPSGSGKTTTLNLITGFAEPTQGSVLMDGMAIERLRPHRRNIGMVFQDYALFPHMTAFDNVAYPLKRRKVPRRELRRRVGETLELTQLTGLESRYPRELSGGQQQRVAFARAVVFRPSLLLMDEPLGALDRRLREALQLEIKRLHRELGITFVYVTHDQAEALALSQRIAVINEGRLEQMASPEQLYEQPASVFVADFLGDSNQFAGDVIGVDKPQALATINGGPWDLRATNPRQLAVGDSGVIIVRPERIHIRPISREEDGRMCGRIVDITYLGSVQRLQVALAAGREAAVVRRAGESPALREGEQVELTWSPETATLLPSGQRQN
jgi:putative spermidine/putrescine transport system ATP-binding protein